MKTTQLILISTVLALQGCAVSYTTPEMAKQKSQQNHELHMQVQENWHKEKMATIEKQKELKESYGYSLLRDEEGRIVIKDEDSDSSYIVDFDSLTLTPRPNE